MSLREMTWIACMVAGDITKYDKADVRHMLEETSYDSVWDFFTRYNSIFGISVNNQLNYLEEINDEMEKELEE